MPGTELWTMVGEPITGLEQSYQAGYKIALNGNGSLLAVSSTNYSTRVAFAGQVTIYRNSSDQGGWTQYRAAITGTETLEQLGRSLSFSEENEFLAVGSSADRSMVRDGFVRVYYDISAAWRVRGNEISNSARGFGDATDISKDGNYLVVGAEDDDSAWVYWFIDGEWVQQGGRIPGPFLSGFGSSVAISADGKTIAVGAPNAIVNRQNLVGSVTTFDLINDAWVQRGETLKGTQEFELFGQSLSLSHDGFKLLIGAPSFGEPGNRKGRIYYYEYTPTVRPANDDICDAIALPVNGEAQGPFTNVDATITTGEENLISSQHPTEHPVEHSVWFTFTAPVSGSISASTCGMASFDTELAIFAGNNCTNFTDFRLEGFNDDGSFGECSGNTRSYLEVDGLNPGQRYFILVDGYSFNTGTFSITLEELATLPACDNPALAFDGVDDHVDLGQTMGNFGTNDFTLEFMVKTSQTVNTAENSHIPLIGKRDGCNCETDFWYVTLEQDGTVLMALSSEGCEVAGSFRSTSHINDGEWHHLAFVRTEAVLELIVDGVQESLEEHPGAPVDLTNMASLQLGSSDCAVAGFGGVFQGQMDELRIWNTTLHTSQVNDFRFRELSGNEEGLIAYYNFNDGHPNADNSDRIGSIDLTGSETVARMYGFARNGTTSNWVTGNTGIVQLDRDEDGLYDACNEPDDLPTATRFQDLPGVHLGQNYPNPTSGETVIPIKLSGQSNGTELRFTSALGKTVKVLLVQGGVDQDIRFNTAELPAGIYFYSLYVGVRLVGTKRMVIAR